MKLIQKIRADIKKVNQIECRFYRDLIALIYNPSLTHKLIDQNINFNFPESTMPELMDWLKDTGTNQIPSLSNYLPLGKYAEELVFFYLTHQSNFSLFENNLQLIEEKITIGELDYLFYSKESEENIHLEFAIKFYLQVNVNGEEMLLGPSTKDWMKRKVDKLLSHQAQLTKSHQHLLPPTVKNIRFTPKVCIKGSLFYPFAQWSPEGKNILKEAWWIHINEINAIISQESTFFTLIEKKVDWIFPFNRRLERMEFNLLKERVSLILAEKNEVMVVRFNLENEIIDKGFVVRLNWPN